MGLQLHGKRKLIWEEHHLRASLSHFLSFVVIFCHFSVICKHLQAFASIFRLQALLSHFLSFFVIFSHLQAFESICKHVQACASICKLLQAFAFAFVENAIFTILL